MTSDRNPYWRNLLSLTVVNILWAAQYPAYKIAGDHMEPGALNFWTFFFATLSLLPFFRRFKADPAVSRRFFTKRNLSDFLWMGLLGIVPPSVLLAWGIAYSSASNGAILSLTIPLLMTIMGAGLLGERVTPIRILTLILGLVGTLCVSVNGVRGASFNSSLLLGNLAILAGAAGSAFYNAYSKYLLSRFTEIEVLVFSYISGGFFCGLISVFFESKPFYRISGYSLEVWLAIIVLGLLSWGLAMVIWMWVLTKLDVGQISVSIYLLPLFGLLLSVVTVHESLHPIQILGGAIVVISTVVLTAFDKPQVAELEKKTVGGDSGDGSHSRPRAPGQNGPSHTGGRSRHR